MMFVVLLIAFSFTWLQLVHLAVGESGVNEGKTRGEQEILTIALGHAFLQTSLLYGLTIVILTEVLSQFHALQWQWVSGFWVFTLVGLLGFYSHDAQKRQADRQRLQALWSLMPLVRHQPILGAIAAILLITLTTTLIAAPNTWDAMTYHLPRVMHWLQNQTVDHYPTHELRQISLSPGSGYLVAQLYLLVGSDRLVGLAQWWAFLGSIVGVFLLGTQWAGFTLGRFSALVCSTLPMAIMQATTPQNDLLVSFWLVCFIYFAFRRPFPSPTDLLWASGALGLGILTKVTTLIFCLLPLLFLAWRLKPWLRGTIGTTGVLLMALIPSLPTFWRNWQTFGQPLGIDFNTRTTVVGIGPLISNLWKNLALNLPIPGIWSFLNWIHQPLLGISLNDPRLNFTPPPPFAAKTSALEAVVKVLAPHNGYVGSPVHLLLLAIAGIGMISIVFHQYRKPRPAQFSIPGELLGLSAANLGSFLLFCALLKWQPWGNRLWLPLLVGSSPTIAWGLSQQFRPPQRSLIALALSLMGIAYALTPMNHPLVSLPVPSVEESASILTLPRSALYFSGARKELQRPYTEAVDIVAQQNCRQIGLALTGEDWEYAFWVLLQNRLGQPFQVRSVGMDNPSSPLPTSLQEDQLCAIISIQTDDRPGGPGQDWKMIPISTQPPMRVFLRGDRL